MAQDFGNGVSRTLSAANRNFQVVVWQANKPPLDSELNLVAQVDWERQSEKVRSQMHSGFISDPMQSDRDFQTSVNWSNWFKFGRPDPSSNGDMLYANVNGWVLPVVGTNLMDGDEANRVNLFPCPDTDTRIDMVYLEVWQAQVAPNPSTQNKPTAQTVWKFGNTLFGGTNPADDLEDPTIGFETTERVQLQYAIRISTKGTSNDLSQYPDGLNDPNVFGQATSTTPSSFNFENMKDTLGDPGLWRSGDGDANNSLGTVDGYSYAIPICAVFRRNRAPYIARINSGNPNQMGGLDRNPTASSTNPVDGTRTFSEVTLTSDLSAGVFGAVSVTGLSGSGLDNSLLNWSGALATQTPFLMLGSEILALDSVDAGAGTITISNPASRQGRGRWGTQDSFHSAGAVLKLFNFRPDEKFSDAIYPTDILDLRRSVTTGEWDYEAMLKHNLDKLFRGDLRTSYKQGNNAQTQGVQFMAADSLMGEGFATNPTPNATERLDGFDGIRTHFSDSVVVQRGITSLLKPTTGGSSVTVVNDFTVGAGAWDVKADFAISGIQPNGQGWEKGTIIDFWIGGVDGNSGARGTDSLTSNKFMRFVSPKEFWKQEVGGVSTYQFPSMTSPVNLQFPWSLPRQIHGTPSVPQTNYGPLAPEYSGTDSFFESPFLFLGGIANTDLYASNASISLGSSPDGFDEIQYPGLNFNIGWAEASTFLYSPGALSTEGITKLLLYGKRNLFDLLSNGGSNLNGDKSELYIVVRDATNAGNNGVYRVIGAGTASYFTNVSASVNDRLVVQAVHASGTVVNGAVVTAEARTQYTNTQDGPTSSASGASSAVIVLGDLTTRSDYRTNGINDQMVISLSVAYGSSRGGTSRVADKIRTVAVLDPDNSLLREANSALDPLFDNDSGTPEGEVYFPVDQNPQVWNGLQPKGAYPPIPLNYIKDVRYLTNMYRESEVFVDEGSKTLIFRPFQKVAMSMFTSFYADAAIYFPEFYDDGVTLIDGAGIKVPNDAVGSREAIYNVPLDYMPKFGRQDIPIRKATGSQNILFGINHLFSDEIGSIASSSEVYNIVGGANSLTGGVNPLLLTTQAATGRLYGGYGLITGGSAYQGRLYEDLNGRSSDFQKRLRGIQLPPFIGIARVYGVYDARDWVSTAGSSAFETDRATLKTTGSPSKNLLRTDADKQTLWILRDGASDVVAGGGAHTYMIPEEAVNIQLSPNYVSSETFEDLEFIVEMEVFVFARGFIDYNNFVFPRKYDGNGQEYTALAALPAGVVNPSDLTNINMILPAAAGTTSNYQGYVAYERTPYQGDPYMTRDGETLQTADYSHRYGQVPVASSFELATPIQQFYTNNTQTPEHVNCRTLEVVATVDFWTTMGTGKVGGPIHENTGLDIGNLQGGSKIPLTATDNPKQPLVRAFSEGQSTKYNLDFGTAQIVVFDNSVLPATFNVRVENDRSLLRNITTGATASDTISAIYTSFEPYQDRLNILLFANGNVLTIRNKFPGKQNTLISLYASGAISGIYISKLDSTTQLRATVSGKDIPMNAARTSNATTPIKMTGSIERLPLGILMQDSDFIGEDPIRTGETLSVKSGGISPAKELRLPLDPSGKEYGRIGSAGFMGMADGSILRYTPYRQGISDSGTKRFRLFRGGGSLYVLDPQNPGGPVDFGMTGFSPENLPVVKGNVLAGRAYLVRNYQEEAFTGNVTRTYGGELQMVISTYAVTGEGITCPQGYALEGYTSPTGWGEGYGAADRYRLEGKPLYQPGSEIGPDCDIFIAPYPSEDPTDDPCA